MHWALNGARDELALAMEVARHGLAEAERRNPTNPPGRLVMPEGVDYSIITGDVLRALEAPLPDVRPVLLPQFRNRPGASSLFDVGAPETSPGSNNWAIRPWRTETGRAFLVDDPHRQVTNPAHRHVIHLNAPGWNVIGATEPGLPGVIRGHNGRVAWGRTATNTDLADVFIEHLNPDNPTEVLHNGRWEPLEIIVEEIAIAGEAPRRVELKYSRHGPIFYEDHDNQRAYALRSFLEEPGTAEYIGGLRLDQATNARDCLVEANYMPMPPTNLVCGDVDGNISYRVSAFAPSRNGWDGRLPVSGTGQYDWAPQRRFDLPSEYNPTRGWIATANHDPQPPTWDPPYGYTPAGRRYYRQERIEALIGEAEVLSFEDMLRILNDNFNIPASERQVYFQGWTGETDELERARRMLADWDSFMRRESAAAALYITWERNVDLDALTEASGPERARLAEVGLREAIAELTRQQGADWLQWRWGRMNMSRFPHYLVSAYDIEAVERHGGAGTVDAIGGVYQLVTDFSDLDNSRFVIAPGVSGQPGSPFYDNLLQTWADNEHLALPYSREAVEAKARYRLTLQPGG